VVEERNAGRDRAATAAVEIERDLDLGLAGLAFNRGRAGGKRLTIGTRARTRLGRGRNLQARSFTTTTTTARRLQMRLVRHLFKLLPSDRRAARRVPDRVLSYLSDGLRVTAAGAGFLILHC
jgi:hypothetical protein